MDRVVVSVRTIAEFSMESGDLYPNMDAYERMQDGAQAHKRLQMAYGEGAKAEVAVALDADVCEIYTDVDGVFTADPRIVPAARRIPVIDYESMLEMSSCGSKVLALRCVEYAQRFNMPLHVRSSFSHRRGTLIVPEGVDPRNLPNI